MIPTLFARGNNKTIESLKKLRLQAQTDKAPRVALRIQGVLMSLQKQSTTAIAESLLINRSTINSWINDWNNHRENGLLEGFRTGRPSRLSAANIEHLADIIESGPVAYGLNTGVWTSLIIAQIIQDEFACSFHPGHVRKLLKKIGFSVQRPTTKLINADPKAQNRWIRYSYPNLKKKPKTKTP